MLTQCPLACSSGWQVADLTYNGKELVCGIWVRDIRLNERGEGLHQRGETGGEEEGRGADDVLTSCLGPAVVHLGFRQAFEWCASLHVEQPPTPSDFKRVAAVGAAVVAMLKLGSCGESEVGQALNTDLPTVCVHVSSLLTWPLASPSR